MTPMCVHLRACASAGGRACTCVRVGVCAYACECGWACGRVRVVQVGAHGCVYSVIRMSVHLYMYICVGT